MNVAYEIRSVEHLGGHRLRLEFADGLVAEVDRRLCPDHCGHFSSSHSRDHVHHVGPVRSSTQRTGSPVATSKVSPSRAATCGADRNRSASDRVLNERVRSRPSTRHFTR